MADRRTRKETGREAVKITTRKKAEEQFLEHGQVLLDKKPQTKNCIQNPKRDV